MTVDEPKFKTTHPNSEYNIGKQLGRFVTTYYLDLNFSAELSVRFAKPHVNPMTRELP